MKQTDRIVIFIVGFVLGTLLISSIMKNKAYKISRTNEVNANLFEDFNEFGLPDDFPEILKKGKLIDSRKLVNDRNESVIVSIFEYNNSYPFVRVTYNINNDKMEIMAADQVVIRLKNGKDVTDLAQILNEYGLFVRMFNRSENIVVISVFGDRINAIDNTINSLSVYNDVIDCIEPDYIKIR